MAAAVIEQRRDLLWSRDNATRVAQVLRAVSYKPREGLFRSEAAYLRLRVIIRRLEAATGEDGLARANATRSRRRCGISACCWKTAMSAMRWSGCATRRSA